MRVDTGTYDILTNRAPVVAFIVGAAVGAVLSAACILTVLEALR